MGTALGRVGTKGEQVYTELHHRLLHGVYEFGEILSTHDLAKELGVSRRPVMDAVMRLEAAGLLTIVRQVGCQVTIPDRRTVSEHFAVAAILEGGGCRLAAASDDPNAHKAIVDANEASQKALRSGDADEFVAANRVFHSAVLEGSGNERLGRLARQAWDLSDFFLQGRRRELDNLAAQDDHDAITAAILAGDPERAGSLMEAHLMHFWERMAASGEGLGPVPVRDGS